MFSWQAHGRETSTLIDMRSKSGPVDRSGQVMAARSLAALRGRVTTDLTGPRPRPPELVGYQSDAGAPPVHTHAHALPRCAMVECPLLYREMF